jgi:hypothetical protein
MKIYLVASPRIVFEDPEVFRKIHRHLAKDHKMLSEMLLKWTDPNKKEKKADEVLTVSHEEMIKKVKQSVETLKKADVVIMEISGHSMSMGYLTAKALEFGKPVIYIQKETSQPHWMEGLDDPKLSNYKYTDENVTEILDKAIAKAKDLIDVRFNFFVSPKILNYLDWVSQKRMEPRAVFLRSIIEKEMKREKEFKG